MENRLCSNCESFGRNEDRICPNLSGPISRWCTDENQRYFFKLKTSKRTCYNCTNFIEQGVICKIDRAGECGNMKLWKPITDKEPTNKEQEMSYKPTSSCTLKNIAAKIHETNCDEARIEFFEFIYKNHISRAERFDAILIKGEYKTTWKQWPDLIKNETRRNWLLQHGFIEEEIRLKPCPHCGETKYAGVVSARAMHDSDKYAYGDDYAMCCNHIKGGCGLHFGYEPSKQEAIKAWNTRK